MPQTARDPRPLAASAAHEALRTWAVVAGLAVTALGLFVMLGWSLNVEALKQIAPGLSTMKFNTAVCLTLLGLAVAIGPRTRIAFVAGATAATIAAISLAEYVTGWNAGIDQVLFRDVPGGSYPGRMAGMTGLCLCAGAIALFAIRIGRRRVATVAALSMLIVGWLGCLGYLFGVKALYDVGSYSTMAGHTAVAIVILGVGVMASTQGGPLPWIVRGHDPGATVMRSILPLALVGLPLAGELRLVAQHDGLYGTSFGLAIMVVVASSSIVAVALHGAHIVNRSQAARTRVNEQLRDLNTTLEARIEERTAELASSEAWARTLADSAPIGIFHSDPHGKRTYVNDRICEIYGMSREQALGGVIGSGVHVEDRERVLTDWADAIGAALEYDGVFRVVQPSGELRWVRALSAGVRGADGALGGTVGTVSDITESHKAELAVRETEAVLSSTFESSPAGLAIVDRDERIIRANHTLSELTGYSPDELVGMRTQSLLSSDNVGSNEVRSADSTSVDQRIVRSDGSVRWVSIGYSKIDEDAAGTSGLTVARFVDTTERRGFEEQLAHMADHDPLTGLLNRRSFEVALESHVAHCKRYGPVGTLMMLDLDQFKEINDNRGHDVGDQVIVATADRLRHRLRETDLIARLGGDEFVVLLPVENGTDACAVAQSLVENLRAGVETAAGENVPLSASVGVAFFDGVERSPAEMLVNADRAMYEAKELGRDQWSEFTPENADAPVSEVLA